MLHLGTMPCGSRKEHGPHEWNWTNKMLRPETVRMSCNGAVAVTYQIRGRPNEWFDRVELV